MMNLALMKLCLQRDLDLCTAAEFRHALGTYTFPTAQM